MTAPESLEEWRAFGYRMSKKVAELSVVVHELFAKNHEKEVENEELREVYEEEIVRVIADANRRLEVIAEVSHHNEEKLRAEQAASLSTADEDRRSALAASQARLEGLLSQLHHAEAEREGLRSRAARLQREVDAARRGAAEEAAAREKDVASAREEQVALRKRLASQERAAREQERLGREERQEVTAELARVRAQLGRVRNERTAAGARVRQLEEEVRALRRELVRRSAAVGAGKGRAGRGEADGGEERPPAEWSVAAPSLASEPEWAAGKQSRESVRSPVSCPRLSDLDHEQLLDEVEQLRLQVQQYKMELSNRDSNFNKVFNSQALRSSSPKRPPGTSQDRMRRSHVTKERTFSYIISQSPAATQEHTPYLRRSSMSQTPSNSQTTLRNRSLPSIADKNAGQQRVTMRYLDGSAPKSWA